MKNNPLKFFVVENHQDTLDAIKMFLEAQGHTVEAAPDMKTALKRAPATNFDVLISDIGLPEMDGYDLIQRVRREASPGRDIPAIALTAYARSEDRTRALRAGFQAHIAKPVEPNELLAMIASFVELTGTGRRLR